ncbi:MAG: 3-dehydroquinate synthase [Treponema sp.]|jgi:3-dehydroquinate synthase|nr:3-dehydroquinate synthase [Treponema sp.]
MKWEYTFSFGGVLSRVCIQNDIPSLDDIVDSNRGFSKALLICDAHTLPIAQQIRGSQEAPICELPPGETAKTWASIETILEAAKDAGLGRDGLFIGVGGGVISDMAAFGASIYMRGAGLCIVSTSLLGMVDAAVGGKTGFDLFGMKNFVGTFYPAPLIYMPIASLSTLPQKEWKSGMAEIIKTAVLDTADTGETFWSLLVNMDPSLFAIDATEEKRAEILECIAYSVQIKGRIVEADPKETGKDRVLLNLGHTFAHALESSAGLGRVSHGEAVAWGMVRACELGLALGLTPQARGEAIVNLLRSFGYETAAPHPLISDVSAFMQALQGDKKKKAGNLSFVVPSQTGSVMVSGEQVSSLLLTRIIGGTLS